MKAIIIAILILFPPSINAQDQFFKENIPLAQYAENACGMPKSVTLALLYRHENSKDKINILKVCKDLLHIQKYSLLKRESNNWRLYLTRFCELYLGRKDEFAGELIAIILENKLYRYE